MTVTKKALSDNISDKLKISKKESSKVLDMFIGFLIENHTKKISINNFGTFSYKKTPHRTGRNPKSGQEFIIKPRMKLNFKTSDLIKKNIN